MKEKSRLILFNGPRHSGKDEAANYCAKKFGANRFKMSGPVKGAIKAMFALTDEDVAMLETIKTEPSPLLFGISYVQAQISFSEDWAKTLWGKDIFGRMASGAVQRWERYAGKGNLYVCSDSGFSEEAASLVYNIISPENTLLVHLCRPGKLFAGDSRNYIRLAGVETVIIANDADLDFYHQTLERVIGPWLGIRPRETTLDEPMECTEGFCPLPNVRTGPSESIFPPIN
jgi:hypothetical protein